MTTLIYDNPDHPGRWRIKVDGDAQAELDAAHALIRRAHRWPEDEVSTTDVIEKIGFIRKEGS